MQIIMLPNAISSLTNTINTYIFNTSISLNVNTGIFNTNRDIVLRILVLL